MMKNDAIDALGTPHGILYPIRTIEQCCQCNYESNIRTDCIYYHCEHDMGASIDCCTLKGLGNCPCSNDCNEYVNKNEVYRLGLEVLRQRSEQNERSKNPERKTGKWVNIRGDNCGDCDQCRHTGYVWMNFCPICGADMRGEENDTK